MGIRRRASIEARLLAIGVCGTMLLIAVPSVVQGVPLEINFSLGGGTACALGTGPPVVDSSLFVPNFFTNDLADLQDFSLSVTASPLRRRVPHSR